MSVVVARPGIDLTAEHLLSLRHFLRRMPPPRLSDNALPGGMVNKRRGRGLEAADIRHFVEGDDIRLIDRNATARTGKLHVRTVHDERDRTALLMADFRASMLWGTRRALRSVAAAEALTLLGWRVIAAGGRVALLAFGAGEPVIIAPRGRDRGMVAVIGGLVRAHRAALAHPDAQEPPLRDALTFARRMMSSGSSIFLASALDAPEDLDRDALGALHDRCPLTVLHMRDAFEIAAPGGAYPFRLASGAGGVSRMAEAHHDEAIRSTLQGWRIGAAELDASLAPEAMADALGYAGV